MSANCYVIHSDNELSSVSKDEVLIQSLAAYMKISFLHDFLFAKVWIRTDLIVVLQKTTSLFFFFYVFWLKLAFVASPRERVDPARRPGTLTFCNRLIGSDI